MHRVERGANKETVAGEEVEDGQREERGKDEVEKERERTGQQAGKQAGWRLPACRGLIVLFGLNITSVVFARSTCPKEQRETNTMASCNQRWPLLLYEQEPGHDKGPMAVSERRACTYTPVTRDETKTRP